MRRKSTRNSTKTPDKPKQTDSADKKGRRTSRRRRKSTSSESEKSEDEHDVQMDVSHEEGAQTESDRDDTPERKTRGRKRKSDVEAADEKVSRRSKRRGTPDGSNEEGATCKGKSKGKNKSKVDKSDHATDNQSETCKESEISANAQVTPQSPETVIDKPVCESAVVVTNECTVDDNGDAKPEDIEGNDMESTTNASDNNQADVENQPAETVKNNTTDDIKIETDTIPDNHSNDNTDEQSSKMTEDKSAQPEFKGKQETQQGSERLKSDKEESSTESIPTEVKSNEEVDKIEETRESVSEDVVEPKQESEVVEAEQSEGNGQEKAAMEEQSEATSQEKDSVDEQSEANVQESIEEQSKSTIQGKGSVIEEANMQTEEDEPMEVDTTQEISRSFNSPQEEQNDTTEEGNEEKDRSLQENKEDIAQKRSFEDSKESIVEKQDFEETEKSNKTRRTSRPSNDDTTSKTERSSERKRRLKLPERQISQTIKLNRTNSEVSDSSSRSKRIWGSGLKLFASITDIDSTIVKTIYPTAQLLEESEVKLESEPKDRKLSTADSVDGKKDRRVSMDSHHGYDRQTSEESARNESAVEQEPDNSNIIAFNRKISIIDDSTAHLKPPPSPAKNVPSDVLFITNLVRPFTLKHLRELLERTGKIKEDGFWTDRIKSKCYVQYDTEEEAKATREALHGVNWPSGNSKKLIIDYGTAEEMEKARNPPQPVVEVSKSDKENEVEQKKKSERAKAREEKEAPTKREHVREWDVGKEDLHRPKSRGHDHSDKRRHSRRSSSPADDYSSKKKKKVEDQVPQKLMDDLFQKTKATPSIYWQPLTPEEIATKQQQRLERMAEHKKLLAENSRGGRLDFVRGAPYRRKYD